MARGLMVPADRLWRGSSADGSASPWGAHARQIDVSMQRSYRLPEDHRLRSPDVTRKFLGNSSTARSHSDPWGKHQFPATPVPPAPQLGLPEQAGGDGAHLLLTGSHQ